MGQQILLLDEPLSNLDAKLRVDVRTELRQIQQKLGITTIYVTHDQDEALSMSDIIAVMRNGVIEQIGSPWEIYFTPVNKFVADFVGTVNFLNGKLLSKDGNTVTVSYCDKTFTCNSSIDLPIGCDLTILLRPESMHIAGNSENLADKIVFDGVIVNKSFLGRVIRYFVKVLDDMFIIDDSNPQMTGPRSGNVQVLLDENLLHLLKNEKY